MAAKAKEKPVDHFAEAAKTAEETSSDARFSTVKPTDVPGLSVEVRGEPKKD